MIQLNLLPDLKLQYIRAQRQKNLVMSVSIITTIACGVIFVFLAITALVWQKVSIDNLTRDISDRSQDLTGTEELDKILTVQNQLRTLPGMHDQKIVSSRLFEIFQKVTPATANVASLSVDFTANTMTLDGSADNLRTVNAFVDNLKATTVTATIDGQQETKVAFSDVVLASFGRAEDATYSVTLTFLPEIFAVTTQNPQLAIAKENSLGRPVGELFQETEGEN